MPEASKAWLSGAGPAQSLTLNLGDILYLVWVLSQTGQFAVVVVILLPGKFAYV